MAGSPRWKEGVTTRSWRTGRKRAQPQKRTSEASEETRREREESGTTPSSGERPPFLSPGDACVQGTDRAIGVICVQPRRLGRVERQKLPLPAFRFPVLSPFATTSTQCHARLVRRPYESGKPVRRKNRGKRSEGRSERARPGAVLQPGRDNSLVSAVAGEQPGPCSRTVASESR